MSWSESHFVLWICLFIDIQCFIYTCIYYFRRIVQSLTKDKVVAVTSTTGVASYQLQNSAKTLHHWSGIRDGRLTKDELNDSFLFDEQFTEARHRIQTAQILVIDEIGMLSKLVFEKVGLVCRIVRDKNLYFGDLQV